MIEQALRNASCTFIAESLTKHCCASTQASYNTFCTTEDMFLGSVCEDLQFASPKHTFTPYFWKITVQQNIEIPGLHLLVPPLDPQSTHFLLFYITSGKKKLL